MPPNTNVTEHREFPDAGAARHGYEESRRLCLDLTNWPLLSGDRNADFTAIAPNGQPPVGRAVQTGDFIRIDLRGPSGYDWVRVEEISSGPDKAQIVVRPSFDPTASPLNTEVTSHFFTREATNTFTLERRGDSLLFLVSGRNEVPNVVEPEAGGYGWLNAAKWGGGSLGLQAYQWQSMGGNLLSPPAHGRPPVPPPPDPPERWRSLLAWTGSFSVSCQTRSSADKASSKLTGSAIGAARPGGRADVRATVEAEKVDPTAMGTIVTRFRGNASKTCGWSVDISVERKTFTVSFGTAYSVDCTVQQTIDGKRSQLDGHTGWAQLVSGPDGPFTGALPKNGFTLSGSSQVARSGGRASASWSFTGTPGPVG